ncbi:MAG: SRPBCC family protein [Jatrophihabitantaceae bacterium]
MTESRYLVTVRRTIAADRQALFDIVADPAQHPVIDGSNSVRALREGAPARLSLGAKFAMDMHRALDYRIVNTVIEFDEPNRIAWRHFNGHIWRYSFADVEGGTEVTEEWDARTTANRLALWLLGYPGRNRAGMLATLQRLDELATHTG